jgi:hypothetical protein
MSKYGAARHAAAVAFDDNQFLRENLISQKEAKVILVYKRGYIT